MPVDPKSQMKALLVIPAYNEEESIERVIENLVANCPQFDFVVVNDGSSDSTAEICRKHAWRFIDLPVNLGLSGAFQAGVKYAARNDYDCVIQFDADGQHRPEYLDVMVAALADVDIVIGSRFVEEKKPHNLRMFGSRLISGMIKVTTGVTIKDPTSGMRAYGKRAIAELAKGENLGPEPDTIAYFIKRKGMTVAEVQVQMDERQAGESYFNLRSSATYMARMALSVLMVQYFR